VEQYGLDPDGVTIAEVDGVVSVTMKVGEPGEEVEKVIMRSSEFGIQHDPGFAVDTIAKNNCEPTDIKPRANDGLIGQDISLELRNYFYELRAELGYYGGTNFTNTVLIDRENQCWGELDDGRDLIYRDKNEMGQLIKLIPMTQEEVVAFVVDR
jgi:hypothetical protein